MQYIEQSCSLEYELTFISMKFIGIRSRNLDIFKKSWIFEDISISRRTLMEHIELGCSLESKLTLTSI